MADRIQTLRELGEQQSGRIYFHPKNYYGLATVWYSLRDKSFHATPGREIRRHPHANWKFADSLARVTADIRAEAAVRDASEL